MQAFSAEIAAKIPATWPVESQAFAPPLVDMRRPLLYLTPAEAEHESDPLVLQAIGITASRGQLRSPPSRSMDRVLDGWSGRHQAYWKTTSEAPQEPLDALRHRSRRLSQRLCV